MARLPQRELFGWSEIDASSDLDRLLLVLSVLPDEEFMQHLERQRGRGRNDYPVRPMWNALLAGIVYGHKSSASLLAELRRNRELLDVCGFNAWRGGIAAPTDDAFGRFLALVVRHFSWIERMVDLVVGELGKELPDLGTRLAADSKGLHSHGRSVKDASKQASRDGRRDLDADIGVKTYAGLHDDGTAWEKITKWFGYKVHLIVDSKYELPLAFRVTKASAPDCPQLVPMVEDLAKRHPSIAGRTKELAADKAYDSGTLNQALWEEHRIKPIIPARTLWREDKTKAVRGDRPDRFLYDEQGHVFCECPKIGTRTEMAFAGFEKNRGTLKYRCPAAAYGMTCHGRADCEALANVGEFGRTLRIPLSDDWRVFTPLARHCHAWEKAYDHRTSVERVNSRIDLLLGFERHFIRGLAKMQARVGLGLLVLLSMALGRIRANQADLMRSMTAPVRKAA